MDRCDYCGTDEQVTVYALDSEYYGKTVRLCPSCLRNKITTSFRPIDKLKLDDMIRSFLLVNDSPYSNAELKRDENCSFFPVSISDRLRALRKGSRGARF